MAVGGMLKQSDADGKFRRQNAEFRNFITLEGPFKPEADRYVLYINWGCPWAHRCNIVRSLKGLESVIQLVVMDFHLTDEGWTFTGNYGSDPKDPLYGFTKIKDLYLKANPDYDQRYTVPLLWDKQQETVVNNESSEIIRMLYTAFDSFLPEDRRETARPMLPEKHKEEIEAMNEWVYHTVNNGVYKTGFASTQAAYEENLLPLFASLDKLEAHLADPAHTPYLFGAHITEADIRLYPTLVRFDTAYHTTFKCNLKMIRHDYPRLHAWLRSLYWDRGVGTNGGAFGKTTYIPLFKRGYATARRMDVMPLGPLPDMVPLSDGED